ncbi:XdhC family protein [Enterococcus wangshanyuanii]|uniref:Xanthine dehydrogenase accessory factor n=1 Tax=Enterococcus wangshanyuanii TaxID=2005703 RepID=A0ABQ1NNM7_9ENTE|nr:XdhC/CoxI family protein [Enterococcus wangshanyuanii]GGC78781.1 hypothetical protein GCM10011573_05610 [Enterococcus wangshanyuanii]
MKEIFDRLSQAVKQNNDTVLVSVIASSGSTPRGEGARMLVDKSGRVAGTIGGGAVEFRSEQLAKEVLETKEPRLEKFILAPNDIVDLGMICGGNVEVLFQYLDCQKKSVIDIRKKFQEHYQENQPCWLISEIGEQLSNRLTFYSRETGFYNEETKELQKLTFKQGMAIMSISDKRFLVESLINTGKVYIFGGGHVAQALVPVLKTLDFYCVVLDDRPELLTKEYFPDADQCVVLDLKNIMDKIDITEDDYVVVMTRGHQFDFDVSKQVLATKAYYIGVMGSKHKIAVQIKRLKESGYKIEEIDRINMPIGLKIKAETPAELAISVAGELIIKRAEK